VGLRDKVGCLLVTGVGSARRICLASQTLIRLAAFDSSRGLSVNAVAEGQ